MAKRSGLDEPLILEIGFGLLSLGVLGGLAALVFGRLFGDARRQARHTEPAPAAGALPAERHQHFSSSPR